MNTHAVRPFIPARLHAHLPCQGSLASGFVQKIASPSETTNPPKPNAIQTWSVGGSANRNVHIRAATAMLIHPQITLVAGLELTENGVI